MHAWELLVMLGMAVVIGSLSDTMLFILLAAILLNMGYLVWRQKRQARRKP
jgi:4-hydroxybenzoate polyprenyltransferase